MTPEKSITRSGVGLGGMRERAFQLGGTLEINSNGKGTTVIARLRLRRIEALCSALSTEAHQIRVSANRSGAGHVWCTRAKSLCLINEIGMWSPKA
jgi:hypothetical protein